MDNNKNELAISGNDNIHPQQNAANILEEVTPKSDRSYREKRKRLIRKIQITFDQAIDLYHSYTDKLQIIEEIKNQITEHEKNPKKLFNIYLLAILFALCLDWLLFSATAEYLAMKVMPTIGIEGVDAFIEKAWPLMARFTIPFIIILGEVFFAFKKHTTIGEVENKMKHEGLDGGLEEKRDWNEVRAWNMMSMALLIVATCLTIALYMVGNEFSSTPEILLLIGISFLATTGHFVVLYGGPEVYNSWIQLFTHKSLKRLKRDLRKEEKNQRHSLYEYRVKYQQLKNLLQRFRGDFPDDLLPADINQLPVGPFQPPAFPGKMQYPSSDGAPYPTVNEPAVS